MEANLDFCSAQDKEEFQYTKYISVMNGSFTDQPVGA